MTDSQVVSLHIHRKYFLCIWLHSYYRPV